MVGGEQHRPVVWVDRPWAFAVVMEGELDHQRLGSRLLELGGADCRMVEVHGDSAVPLQPELAEQRCEHPPEDAQPGMTFADVVEQRRPDQIRPLGGALLGEPGSPVGVTLVGRRLITEERLLWSVERPFDECRLVRIERLR